jgi:regulatory protein
MTPRFFFLVIRSEAKDDTDPMTDSRRPRSTYDRALDMLEARARGVAELRRLLLRKGEPEADVDAAIERLRANGLLDDANFARQLARSKALGAGLSRRRIAQELAKRGVDRSVSADAIDDVFESEEVDEEASLERVARKKLRTLGNLDDATRRRRLFGFLARRGYESDDIQRVVRVLLSDDGSEWAAASVRPS